MTRLHIFSVGTDLLTPQSAASGSFLQPNKEIRLNPFMIRGRVVSLLSTMPEWCPLCKCTHHQILLLMMMMLKIMALTTSSALRKHSIHKSSSLQCCVDSQSAYRETDSVVTMIMNSEASLPGFKSLFCRIRAMWPWPNYLASLGLSFFICTLRIISILPRVVMRIKWVNMSNGLKTVSNT